MWLLQPWKQQQLWEPRFHGHLLLHHSQYDLLLLYLPHSIPGLANHRTLRLEAKPLSSSTGRPHLLSIVSLLHRNGFSDFTNTQCFVISYTPPPDMGQKYVPPACFDMS